MKGVFTISHLEISDKPISLEMLCMPVVLSVAESFGMNCHELHELEELSLVKKLIPSCLLKLQPDYVLLKDNTTIALEIADFSSSGANLYSIIETYAEKQQEYRRIGFHLIVITDGHRYGKNIMNRKLYSLFNKIDYVINYSSAHDGALDVILEDIMNKELNTG